MDSVGQKIAMTPWLSQAEVDDLCAPLTQPAAQIRYLRALGLAVRTKPSGAPLVLRSNIEQIMNPGGKPATSTRREPNRAALVASFGPAA